MPRGGLRSIPPGSNPVLTQGAMHERTWETVDLQLMGALASEPVARLPLPAIHGHAGTSASGVLPSSTRCLSGHRRPAAPVRETVFTVQRRTDMRPGCQNGAASSPMPARRDGSRAHWPCGRTAHLRRESPARPSEDRMATGRRRLNHRSTSGWTLARHAGCHAALPLHRLTAHSSLMHINLVPRIGFFLGHV